MFSENFRRPSMIEYHILWLFSIFIFTIWYCLLCQNVWNCRLSAMYRQVFGAKIEKTLVRINITEWPWFSLCNTFRLLPCQWRDTKRVKTSIIVGHVFCLLYLYALDAIKQASTLFRLNSGTISIFIRVFMLKHQFNRIILDVQLHPLTTVTPFINCENSNHVLFMLLNVHNYTPILIRNCVLFVKSL